MDMITVEQFERVLPKGAKKVLTPQMMGNINKLVTDPEVREVYRDNLLGYAGVMADGKFKLESYINAVRYVSFKLHSTSNIEAYTKTFPDKYQDFLNKNVAAKDIASYVTAYNKSKLVNLIWEQTLVPVAILNADLLQRALNTQAEIMADEDVSPKVRSDAANSLITALNRQETKKIELDVSVKEDKSILDLRSTMKELVVQQKDIMLAGGMNARDVAHSELVINGECEEI